MKVVAVFFVCFCLFFAGNAFAEVTVTWTDADAQRIVIVAGELEVPLSPRVSADYKSNATQYIIGTRNSQGTRTFGTAQDFTGIYWGAIDEPLPALGGSWDSSKWSTL